jgi:hypothetical protein
MKPEKERKIHVFFFLLFNRTNQKAKMLIQYVSFAAECVTDRTDVQCLHRWQKVLNPNLVKGPWSKEVQITYQWLHVSFNKDLHLKVHCL